MMFMEHLLQSNDFLAIINKHRRAINVTPILHSTPIPITEDCSLPAFDIIDNSNGGPIIRPQGSGTAHYFNSPQEPLRNMRFIEYEKFINSLPQDYNHEWSRADFIAYDTSPCKSYFIIHELTEGTFQNKRTDAIRQMQNTLMRLYECAQIKNYIQLFQNKWCILSATGGAQQAPLDMTAGFNVIYAKLPDPEPLNANIIERRGFKAWRTLNVKL